MHDCSFTNAAAIFPVLGTTDATLGQKEEHRCDNACDGISLLFCHERQGLVECFALLGSTRNLLKYFLRHSMHVRHSEGTGLCCQHLQ